jgi:hypothetical protein
VRTRPPGARRCPLTSGHLTASVRHNVATLARGPADRSMTSTNVCDTRDLAAQQKRKRTAIMARPLAVHWIRSRLHHLALVRP